MLNAPTLKAVVPQHQFSIRVYYEDTDAGGIVYYANYLKFAERARTELLRDAGFYHTAMQQSDGLILAVRRVNAEYLRPAKLDDMLDITTNVINLGAATVELVQTIHHGEQELCQIQVTIACLGRDGKPTRLPVALRSVLSAKIFS